METNSEYLMMFLLNAGWQISVVVALAATANVLLREGPARYRHWIWVSALVASAILPVYSTTRPAVTSSIALSVPLPVALPAPVTANPNSQPRRAALSESRPSVRFPADVGRIVALLYGLLLLYNSVRFAKACSKTASIRASAERPLPPAALAGVWILCTETFGLSTVQLLRSERVCSPVALGILRPAVIVPEHLWHETSEEVLKAAIGHELAHVARNDFLCNLIFEVLFIFLGFQPSDVVHAAPA